MRRPRVLVCAAGAAALLGCGPVAAGAPAGAVLAGGLWGRAIAVPGLGALNKGGNAGVSSVSCAAPGSCSAGGFYKNHGIQGFVVIERNGRWLRAVEVPGLGALNKGRYADVLSVSCAMPGKCAAGGYYGNHGNQYVVTSGRGFVVSERNGRWGQAVRVPGLAALNKGGNSEVSSVSCASPGNCTAGGDYTDGGGYQRGFVVSEKDGVWGRAVEVPGLGVLSKDVGLGIGVSSVSCASPGNCAAGWACDVVVAGGGCTTAFVVSEKNGVWGTAQEVAGNLNTGRDAGIFSVSCASAGNCAAGGESADASGTEAFVVSEVSGTWAAAQGVAGTLNSSGPASITSLSCGSAGNCSGGGFYDYGGYFAPFLVSEKNGTWGQAIDVPGLVTRDASVESVSCASAGNCGAGGYFDGAGSGGFVVSEKNGVWGKGIVVPGPLYNAFVGSVSCASAGSCVAGGYYTDGHGKFQGFVT